MTGFTKINDVWTHQYESSFQITVFRNEENEIGYSVDVLLVNEKKDELLTIYNNSSLNCCIHTALQQVHQIANTGFFGTMCRELNVLLLDDDMNYIDDTWFDIWDTPASAITEWIKDGLNEDESQAATS